MIALAAFPLTFRASALHTAFTARFTAFSRGRRVTFITFDGGRAPLSSSGTAA
jgi:hypothetical protein